MQALQNFSNWALHTPTGRTVTGVTLTVALVATAILALVFLPATAAAIVCAGALVGAIVSITVFARNNNAVPVYGAPGV